MDRQKNEGKTKKYLFAIQVCICFLLSSSCFSIIDQGMKLVHEENYLVSENYQPVHFKKLSAVGIDSKKYWQRPGKRRHMLTKNSFDL
jgi:hypothetical protein